MEASDLVRDLSGLLCIPSVAADKSSLASAVEWVCSMVESAGGVIEHEHFLGMPLGVATIPASIDKSAAPTVLLYGHVDVQPVGEADDWSSDPFDPIVRDGWLYARGAADDKGPFYALLRAAVDLANEGRLPANVRILCDTEEETSGDTAIRFLASDTAPIDACAIFDVTLHQPLEPILVIATRGIASMRVALRVREDDVHSGSYGGVAINAAHVLVRILCAALSAHDELDAALRHGIVEPSADELRAWEGIDVHRMLAAAGVRCEHSPSTTLHRLWAEPALDVHGLRSGITSRELNAVPAAAEAILSVRVAPGQNVFDIGSACERLLRSASPEGVELSVTPLSRTPPAGPFDLSGPAMMSVRRALERGFGRTPAIARSGGSLPILAALHARNIPTALSGLALPDSHVHGTNERIRIDHLQLGITAARELLLAWNAPALRPALS